VHPGGSSAAMRTAEVAHLLKSGRPVLVLDAFAGTMARTQRLQSDSYFLSYNRTVDAERVQDILTAAAFLRGPMGGRVEVLGLGDAGVWAVFAAAVAPVHIEVQADLHGFGGTDQDFRDRFFIPGIQRAGGWTAALRLANQVRTILPAGDTSAESSGPEQ